jgi:hypothetical protein
LLISVIIKRINSFDLLYVHTHKIAKTNRIKLEETTLYHLKITGLALMAVPTQKAKQIGK